MADSDFDPAYLGESVDHVDITSVTVIDDMPISWQTLPDNTYTSGDRSRVRLRDYINNYTDSVVVTVHEDTPLPDGWTLTANTRLFVFPQVARVIRLKFVATLGNQSVESGYLTIRRTQVMQFTLSPNRQYLETGFDQVNNRLWLFSASPQHITPTVRYFDSFELDGTHNLGDAIVFDSGLITTSNWIIPEGATGLCFDGEHLWIAGRADDGSGGELLKMDTSGREVSTYTYQSTYRLDALTWDGTYVWALDTLTRSIRAYNTSGVEQTSLRVALHSTQFSFSDGQFAVVAGDNHFWVLDLLGTTLKCVSATGSRVTTRDVVLPSDHSPVIGLIYNNDTNNIWYLIQRPASYQGTLYGVSV